MKAPKVSVIIPVYNSERFIGQTIDSIFNQSYRDFELIVVDDGSRDGTDKVISRYKDRLIYIRKENEGVSVARNRGIAIARGEYIAFIDHDDIWLPEKLKEQISLLEANKKIYLIFSDAYIIDEKGRRNSSLFKMCPPHKGMVFRHLLRDNFIPVITAVVKKKAFKEIGLFDPHYKIAEDWDFFLRISERYPVAFVERPLAEYRIHSGGFSRHRNLMFEEAISIMNRYTGPVDKATARMVKMRKRKFQFDLGVVYLQKGMRSKARGYFLAKVKEEPFASCFYLGLLVTYLPDSWIKFIDQILPSKGR